MGRALILENVKILEEAPKRLVSERLAVETGFLECISPSCDECKIFSSCPPFYRIEERSELSSVIVARDQQLVRVLPVFEHTQLGERVGERFSLYFVSVRLSKLQDLVGENGCKLEKMAICHRLVRCTRPISLGERGTLERLAVYGALPASARVAFILATRVGVSGHGVSKS